MGIGFGRFAAANYQSDGFQGLGLGGVSSGVSERIYAERQMKRHHALMARERGIDTFADGYWFTRCDACGFVIEVLEEKYAPGSNFCYECGIAKQKKKRTKKTKPHVDTQCLHCNKPMRVQKQSLKIAIKMRGGVSCWTCARRRRRK